MGYHSPCERHVVASNLAEVILCRVPHHGRASVNSGPSLLHDDTRDYVLVGLVERLHLFEAVVDDCICPIRHLREGRNQRRGSIDMRWNLFSRTCGWLLSGLRSRVRDKKETAPPPALDIPPVNLFVSFTMWKLHISYSLGPIFAIANVGMRVFIFYIVRHDEQHG